MRPPCRALRDLLWPDTKKYRLIETLLMSQGTAVQRSQDGQDANQSHVVLEIAY